MSDEAQRDFFRGVELDYWADAEGLKDEEQALIEANLDRRGPTLEAGTGGGRIVRAMAAAGYERLHGFDFAPELIDAAREAVGGMIEFTVADAAELPYEDASFAQALYLQQVVCTIEAAGGRRAALAEARRVLASGGLALFSFVCLESRTGSLAEGAFVRYLRALRKLRRDTRPLQSMPRLRVGGRLAASALRDRGPHNWWYGLAEVERALAIAGFAVEGIGTGADVLAGTFAPSATERLRRPVSGTLYVVARAA